MTPRKTQRHAKKPSQSNLNFQVQPSDYESESQFIVPTTRTNTDLNLSVLRRYIPDITTILSIAPAAVIYNFIADEQTWEKADVEGTLFVCQLQASPLASKDRYSIAVLNKKSMDNLIVEMNVVQDVEITTQFLILRWTDDTGERIVGVYIHEDQEDTRVVNCNLIKECWLSVTETEDTEEPKQYGEDVFEDSDGQFVGRSVSVNQLFGR